MGRYIARRLLIAIPTLIVISFVIYAILALAPIDPLSQFGADPRVPAEVRERIRESLGLNQPWPLRYVKWVTAMFRGDFGVSFMSHSSVGDLIAQRLPNTLAVVGVAYILGVLMGIPVGMISAIKRYSFFDHAATTLAFMGFSVPTFFTGLLLIIIFGIKLRWFPFIYSSTLQVHDLESIGQQIKQSIMPITVLALSHPDPGAPYPLQRTATTEALLTATTVKANMLRPPLSLWSDAWYQFRRHQLAMAGLIVLSFLIIATLVGPYVWPTKMDAIDFAQSLQGPSADHPFGTDDLGRDIFARSLWGGRVSIAVGLTAVIIAFTLGMTIGSLAGYFGRLDNPLMRLTDLFLSLPILPLLLIIIYLFRY